MKASTAGRQNKSENIKKCQTEESENNPQQTGRTHVEQSTAARQEQIQKHAQGKAIENQIADRQETNQSTSSMNKGNRGTD